MKVIVGGAYQGKLDYAKEILGVRTYTVCDENVAELDCSADAIDHLERFTLACARQGIDALAYLEEHREQLKGKVVICTDISQGIVPMEKELRAWREINGRVLIDLCREAEMVIRVFCGLGQQLK